MYLQDVRRPIDKEKQCCPLCTWANSLQAESFAKPVVFFCNLSEAEWTQFSADVQWLGLCNGIACFLQWNLL